MSAVAVRSSAGTALANTIVVDSRDSMDGGDAKVRGRTALRLGLPLCQCENEKNPLIGLGVF